MQSEHKTVHPRHGGPYDRGSADKYYGRPYKPHYWSGASYTSTLITQDKMTDEEITEYKKGWDEEDDKKDWGYF